MSTGGADLLLLSGGVESTTLLYRLRGQPLHAVSIDYGQRAAAREYAAARWHCERLQVPLTRLQMPQAGEAFRAHQTHKLHVPIPHRNLFILSLSVAFAAQQGARRIYLSINREDSERHPSAAPGFLERFNAMVQALEPIAVHTPLAADSKAAIILQGLSAGVDFAHTYSCLLGHARHCGGCPQCRSRRAAFAAAAQSEPAGFYRHGGDVV